MSKSLAVFVPREHHVPSVATRERVRACIFAGIPRVHIAEVLGVCLDTLEAHYRHELNTSLQHSITNLSSTAYAMALNGNDKLLMFLLKTRGGKEWQDKQVIEHGVSKELEELQTKMLDLEKNFEKDF